MPAFERQLYLILLSYKMIHCQPESRWIRGGEKNHFECSQHRYWGDLEATRNSEVYQRFANGAGGSCSITKWSGSRDPWSLGRSWYPKERSTSETALQATTQGEAPWFLLPSTHPSGSHWSTRVSQSQLKTTETVSDTKLQSLGHHPT